MSRVPLSSDDTVVIFAEEFEDALAALDHTVVCNVWNRLETIVTHSAPTRRFIREQVTNAEELEVIGVDDQYRIYCLLTDDIEDLDILNVFYVHKHDYTGWGRFDAAAVEIIDEIRDRQRAGNIRHYLLDQDGHWPEDIEEIYDTVC